MRKVGEKISLVILALVYLLCSLRYFPNQPAASLLNTATHLLTVAPFLIGALLLFNSFYQRQAGERPAPVKMLRLGLTLGILIEFFIGIYNYLEINQVG
jgi:hypothetical protein